MPKPPAHARRDAGPWIIVEVPMETDDLAEIPLYPSRRRFYCAVDTHSAEHIDQAHHFEDRKEAQRKANQIMHKSRNTWAEVVPLSIAWALVHACGATWNPRMKVAG